MDYDLTHQEKSQTLCALIYANTPEDLTHRGPTAPSGSSCKAEGGGAGTQHKGGDCSPCLQTVWTFQRLAWLVGGRPVSERQGCRPRWRAGESGPRGPCAGPPHGLNGALRPGARPGLCCHFSLGLSGPEGGRLTPQRGADGTAADGRAQDRAQRPRGARGREGRAQADSAGTESRTRAGPDQEGALAPFCLGLFNQEVAWPGRAFGERSDDKGEAEWGGVEWLWQELLLSRKKGRHAQTDGSGTVRTGPGSRIFNR